MQPEPSPAHSESPSEPAATSRFHHPRRNTPRLKHANASRIAWRVLNDQWLGEDGLVCLSQQGSVSVMRAFGNAAGESKSVKISYRVYRETCHKDWSEDGFYYYDAW